MRFSFALLLVVSLVGAAIGQEIKLPEETKALPGRLTRLIAETEGKTVRWLVASEDADLIPLDSGGKVAIFSAAKPGRYLVFAWTAKGDTPSEAARSVVIVADLIPPKPPEPPAPPVPTDPLTIELRALYAADVGENKLKNLQGLCELYRIAQTQIDVPEIVTAGQLAKVIKDASAGAVEPGALGPLRKRVSAVLAEMLPADSDAVLTSEIRLRAKAAFARVSKCICEAK